jgi:ABC-type transport system substrate-binding protein
MAGALNRDGIQAAGNNDPVSAIKQFAASSADYAYIDDLASPDFDLEAAKALFDSTGEEPFTFKNGHIRGGFWPATSSAFATALAELGITMENEVLEPNSAGEMFANLAKGTYPVQIIAYNEPNALMSLIARTGEAAFNPSGVSPDGVDELVASARTKSFEDGEADVAAAWKILIEECIFIINNVLTTSLGYDPDDVQGVNHTGGIPISYWPHGVTKG